MNRITRIVILAASALTLAAGAGEAQASFPGLNGRIAFDRGTSSGIAIYTMNPDGTDQRWCTLGHAPDWSADGSKLVFVREGDIYVVNADCTGERRLTLDGRRHQAAWSADGTKIATTYQSPAGSWLDVGDDDIRVINSVVGSEVNRPANSGDEERDPAWSPDGTKIAYAHMLEIGSWAETTHDWDYGIFTMNPDGSGKQRLGGAYKGFASSPDWSPDGQKLAYTGTDKVVYVESLAGGLPRRVTDQGMSPSWSPDGTKIAFGWNGGIFVADATGGGERYITNGSSPDWQSIRLTLCSCFSPPLPPKR